MFFTESVYLAERHPNLAVAIERIDAQLGKMGTAEVIRADDWASFLGIDPNQVNAVLQKLAHEELLRAEDMVECAYCGMVVLHSEYLEHQEEDGEYRCTSCDRPLTDTTVMPITTYRRGEKWKEVSALKEDSASTDLSNDAVKQAATMPDFTPTPDDLQILRALETSPTTLTLVAIEAATSISRKTVGERVKVFRRHGLVHEPHRLKGITLSDAGRAFLWHICGKSTPTLVRSPQITH